MATLQKMKAPLFSAYGYRRGMARLNIRKSVWVNPNTYGLFKNYLFGSTGPVIKMWDGVSWKIIGLT